MSKLEKKTEIDLRKELAEFEGKLREFRFAIAGSKTRNVREGRSLKRAIAGHLTELAARART